MWGVITHEVLCLRARSIYQSLEVLSMRTDVYIQERLHAHGRDGK